MVNHIAWMLLLSALTGRAQAGGCRVVNVSAGDTFTCAVLHNGSAWCWGSALFGDLGRPDNTTTSDPNGPPLDFGAGRSVLQLATYASSSCALLDNHTVSCWGRGSEGQLGLGDVQASKHPTQVPLGTGNQTVQQISTGCLAFHSCAFVTGEGVFCWGSAEELHGTPWLGKPNTKDMDGTQVILPSKVDLGSDSRSSLIVLEICSGWGRTCVLSVELGLKCWGGGVFTSNLLGLGNISDTTGLTGTSLPPVNLGAGRLAVQISCGDSHTCAVLDNGDLKCFGNNDYGELGYGDTRSRGAKDTDMGDALQPVDVGKGRTVKQVTVGVAHTCALLDNGQLKCWGANDEGQLGHHCSTSTWGDSPGQMGDSLPAVDLGPGCTAVSITAGQGHSCVVLDNGSIKCWGRNDGGQLGFNSSSVSVCPPNQTVDLGSSCTSSPGNSTSLNSSPSPTAPTPPASKAPTPTRTTTITTPSISPSLAPSPLLSPSSSPSPSPSPFSTTTAATSTSSSSHSVSVGIIAGAVIAAVVAIALSGWAVWWWRNRRQSSPTTGTVASVNRSKQPSAQVVIVASDGAATNVAPEVAAVRSTSNFKPVKIAGLPQGGRFALITARNYSWIEAAALAGPLHAVEAGVNDIQLDKKLQERPRTQQVAAPLYCPAVQLSRDQLRQQVQLLSDGLLGRGATAVVFKCVWPSRFGPNALLAAKVLQSGSESDMTELASFAYEAKLLAGIQHPHVVKLYGYCLEPPTVCLILELLPCSLKDVLYKTDPEAASSQVTGNTASNSQHMSRQGVPTPTSSARQTMSSSNVNEPSMSLEAATDDVINDSTVEVKVHDSAALESNVHPVRPVMLPQIVRLCTEIAAGLAFLHSQPAPVATVGGKEHHVSIPSTRDGRIVHRDMKPANILFNSQGIARISDFGLARQHDHTTFATINLGAGTLPYMAPELLISSKAGVSGAACTNRVDIYSLGIIMWELLMGQPPWQGMSTAAIIAAVMNRRRLPLPDDDQAQSQDREHAIMDMPLLQTLPAHSHPDLPKMCHIIQACWQHRELRRPTAVALHGTLSALLQQLEQSTSTSS